MKYYLFLIILLINNSILSYEPKSRPTNWDNLKEPENSIISESKKRFYNLRLPKDYKRESYYPIIYVLHGAEGNGEIMEILSGFTHYGEINNYIIVYPYGTGKSEWKSLFWNADGCCGISVENKTNDVQYFKDLHSKLLKKYNIDENLVFIAGYSNGAMMALKIACQVPNTFKGVASVSGTMFDLESCNTDNPISILLINGREDKIVRYDGNLGSGPYLIYPKNSISKIFDFFENKNNCEVDKLENSENIEIQISKCKSKIILKKVILTKDGHIWPGSHISFTKNPQISKINATLEIMNFFDLFKKND
jgi:polyhydroxybutyrate depolymerase